jgi:hypothetical protein
LLDTQSTRKFLEKNIQPVPTGEIDIGLLQNKILEYTNAINDYNNDYSEILALNLKPTIEIKSPSTLSPSLPTSDTGSSTVISNVSDPIMTMYKASLAELVSKRSVLGDKFLNAIEVHREYFAKVMCLVKYLGGDTLKQYSTATDLNVFNETTKTLYKKNITDKGASEFYDMVKKHELLKVLNDLAKEEVKYILETDLTSSTLSHIKTLKDICGSLQPSVTTYLSHYPNTVYMNYLMCFITDLDLFGTVSTTPPSLASQQTPTPSTPHHPPPPPPSPITTTTIHIAFIFSFSEYNFIFKFWKNTILEGLGKRQKVGGVGVCAFIGYSTNDI